ncbi:MAG TPA: carboxypeptidase-like regulatory domain-containing protein [Gemmatimonadales bacterium]|jgi:hypothetical protein
MLFLVATAATLFALQAPDASDEGPVASITGLVYDAETGEPVAGAVAAVAGTPLTSLTQSDGHYTLSHIPQGTWALVVARPQYRPHTFSAIVPSSGVVRIDVGLHLAPTTLPPIEVRAAASRGNRNSAWAARRVTAADVRNDPRLAEADPLQAIVGGGVALRPESSEGLHILGGASDQVAYSLDDVPVFSPYHSGGTLGAWNPDAVGQLEVQSSPGSPADPDGLSGSVSATTITPAPRHQLRGSISSTQIRSTFDGPVGWKDAGYLLSLRSTFPGLLPHSGEGSYLEGDASDWLAKIESPFAGGRLRLLGYGSDNDISTARGTVVSPGAAIAGRNGFRWSARSFGANWSHRAGGAFLKLGVWSAGSDAGAAWLADSSSITRLSAYRQDVGAYGVADVGGAGKLTSLHLHARRSATSYAATSGSDAGATTNLDRTALLWTADITHERPTSAHSTLIFSLGAGGAGAMFRVDPGVEIRWTPTRSVRLSAGVSRRHQFAQSLRNDESVVGAIFPAELFVGAGAKGVPVARSDLGVVTLEYRPEANTRLTGKAYLRNLGGLVLVAPLSTGPFAGPGPAGFLAGSGTSAGITMEAAASGPSYGLTLGYGLQRTRLAFGDSKYVPAYGVAHSLEAGALLMASPGTSLKVGVTALFGRHGTSVTGPFEWESCNLLDNGCEFAGSPREATQELGLLDLPPYLRLDLGVRHRWLLHLANRDAELAIFGTVTNILDRQNILTKVIDPKTGGRGPVDMRHRSPLVVGLDWRY